jgi:hypothetical protein
MSKFVIDDWRIVLKKSAAVWVSVLSVVFGVLELQADNITALLQATVPLLPKGVLGSMSVVLAAGVPLARIYKQAKLQIALALEEERRAREASEK